MQSNKKAHLFSIDVDTFTMSETVDAISRAIENKKQLHHACLNAGKVVLMQKDRELYESVKASNLINADGQAIVWASKILSSHPIPERVSGIDLMDKIVEMASKKDYKVYFFGAKQEFLDKTLEHYTSKYGEKIVAGSRNGYFQPEEEINIAKDIRESGAHILFVAIKSPIKENFLYRNKELLKDTYFIMGVGGSFDVFAGKVKRAPMWAQKNGLEWLYRLVQEPKKLWRRYLIGNFVFVYLVLKELFKKN